MRDLTVEWLEKQLARYENKAGDSHAWGPVSSISAGGTLNVTLNRSGTPVECMPFCDAAVGDVVFVCIMPSGDAAAIARLRR